jgi:hypothetical protein
MLDNIETCHHCGEQKTNYYRGFISMIIPHPELESKIDKWGRDNWWENLERTDLTEDETKELSSLALYDQALNTVGRGIQCDDCYQSETELYNQYYPER